MSTKTRVLFCGTIPTQNNGYSKVVYELAKRLAGYDDIDLHIFGFQGFYKNEQHELERKLPNNVTIFDVFAHEEPQKTGFGDDIIQDYVKQFKPHMVIVYNDLVVLYRLIKKLTELPEEHKTFKIVPYIDIVYNNEKNALIKFLQDTCDGAIMFTEYWKSVIETQGFVKPMHIVEHGFDKMNYYPIPKDIARNYFSMNQDDFIMLNLNRNQPRKRWDTCMQAFIKFISTHQKDPIKLLIGTDIQGSWDLIDIFISECRLYKMDPDEAKSHLIIMNGPQKLTDKDINVLYNSADVGLNTCDGEGFGLCNFEHAAIGIPQIVSNVGGFKDYFTNKNAFLVNPKWSYYVDASRDIVSGKAEICDIDDIVEMMEHAYTNRDKLRKFGQHARTSILDKYNWEDKAKVFYECIQYHTKDMVKKPLSSTNKQSENLILGSSPFIINNDIKLNKPQAENKISLENIEIYDGSEDNDTDIDIADKTADKTTDKSTYKDTAKTTDKITTNNSRTMEIDAFKNKGPKKQKNKETPVIVKEEEPVVTKKDQTNEKKTPNEIIDSIKPKQTDTEMVHSISKPISEETETIKIPELVKAPESLETNNSNNSLNILSEPVAVSETTLPVSEASSLVESVGNINASNIDTKINEIKPVEEKKTSEQSDEIKKLIEMQEQLAKMIQAIINK